jgi:serine/threonine protein kinase
MCKTKEKFTENLVLNCMVQVIHAIAYRHSHAILHRNLKPKNIIISPIDNIKVIDFGLATIVESNTKAIDFGGTREYMSPEVVNRQAYSFSSGLWSLEVTIYHLCKLKLPFPAKSLILLKYQIIKSHFSPLPPRYSMDLVNVVNALLTVNIKERLTLNSLLSNVSYHLDSSLRILALDKKHGYL